MSKSWKQVESEALAIKVIEPVLANLGPMMAHPGWPAGLTTDLIRSTLMPSAVSALLKKIEAGWSPKKGWLTAEAQAANSGGAVMSEAETAELTWRILLFEMPEEELSKLHLTRVQVEATLRRTDPALAATLLGG